MRNRKPEGYLSLSINTVTLDPEKPDEFERSNSNIRKSSDMNTTVNGSSCFSPFNSTAAKIGKTFAFCLILVISLLGNSLIAIIVYKTQTLRKPINFFIVNMAMSDMLSSIFPIPGEITYLYTDAWLNISGPLGRALCKLVAVSIFVSSTVSIQSLLLIAVDRFGAVIFPLRSLLISLKMCSFFILSTWIVAISVFSPFFSAWKPTEYQGQLVCIRRWNEVFEESSSLGNFLLAASVVFLYIPIVMLTTLYSIIVIKLKSQKRPGEQSTNAEQQRAKRSRNVLKMAIAIVLGFVLCFVPFSIDVLLLYFARQALPCGFYTFRNITRFMAGSNCAINPCICFIFSTNYRSALKRLFNCLRGATVSVRGAAQRE